MNKKIYSILLILVMILTLSSCRIQGGDSYKVSFDTNGGNKIQSIEVKYGESFLYPTPIKEGHTFDGWFTDKNLTVNATPGTVFSDDVTLYAKWSINTYSVTFMLDEELMYGIKSDKFGSEIRIDDPSLLNHTFKGWYTDTSFTTKFNNKIPSHDAYIYAKWVPNEVNISFVSIGSPSHQKMDDVTLIWGLNTTLPENIFTKEGFEFIGWAKSPDSDLVYRDNETLSSIPKTESYTLYAVWKPLLYSVIYIADGERFGDIIEKEYGSTIDVPVDVPLKEGYQFSYWYIYRETNDTTFIENKDYYTLLNNIYSIANVEP